MMKYRSFTAAGLKRPVLALASTIGVVAALAVGASASWAASPAAAGAASSSRAAPAGSGKAPGGAAVTPGHAAQQRQLALTTLSHFKVVLTATRVSEFNATVTAAGYRRTSGGWALIATKRIGQAGSWAWFATDVCSLRTTQFKPAPSSAEPYDSITVSMLYGPAIGCVGPYTKTWQP